VEISVENSGHLRDPLEAGVKLQPFVNNQQPIVD